MTAQTQVLSILPVAAVLVVTDPVNASTNVPTKADTLKLIGIGIGRVRSRSPFPWIDFDPDSVAIFTGSDRLYA